MAQSVHLIYAKNCSAPGVEMVSPKFQARTADTGRKHSSSALENAVPGRNGWGSGVNWTGRLVHARDCSADEPQESKRANGSRQNARAKTSHAQNILSVVRPDELKRKG